MPPTTDTQEIEIRIKSIEQLFNSLDPAPFRERELDREAERHIVSYAREATADQPLNLVIYLPATPEPALAKEVEAAIGHHFALQAREREAELGELRRLGRKGLAVGLLVMLFATLAGVALTNAFPDSRFIETIEHSLIIFGWVALWRPIEILLYDRWPLIRARKLFQRLATAPVVVRPATASR
ncbi:MAG: hypothetical protein KA535_00035 [Azonexus sp.]|nr:hypothetical protein [Azonexus sp.]